MNKIFITLIACSSAVGTIKAETPPPWIAGNWTDPGGNDIEVTQEGVKVRAVMQGKDGLQYWHNAEATFLPNGKLEMRHYKGSSLTDTQLGSVDEIARTITFQNGSHWQKRHDRNLGGFWRDTSGNDIEIRQAGNGITATMLSTDGKKYWTLAKGTMDDNSKILMIHQKDGKPTEAQEGDIGAKQIDWSNKSKWFQIPTIRGRWVDSFGASLEIAQTGMNVEVRLTGGTSSWTRARGTVQHNGVINLTHYHGSRETDRQKGNIRHQGGKIQWGNGSHWLRK